MLHGVLDPQPGMLAFALFDGQKKLFEKIRIMHGRDAAGLPDFVAGSLAEAGLTLTDVLRWSIGSGPGSFTFLRIVAAMCAGWKYGHPQIRFRCVPGAIALAGMLAPAPGEKVAAIYDGRNREILYFEVICDPENGILKPSGVTAVLNAEQAREFLLDRPEIKVAVMDNEAEAAAKVLPPGYPVLRVAHPDTALLAQSDLPFDDDLDRLVYIRPAVFTNNGN